MGILTDAPLSSSDCPDGLTEALLPAVPRRRSLGCAICVSKSRFFARLPSVCGESAAIAVRREAWAAGSRGAEAIVVFFGHGKEVGLEGGELKGSVRTRVPRRCGGHGDGTWNVVGRGSWGIRGLRHEDRESWGGTG